MFRLRNSTFVAVAVAVAILLTTAVPPAEAASTTKVYTVTSLQDDDTAGSLGWALTQAQTVGKKSRAVITFADGLAGTIALTGPLPTIATSVEIYGPGIVIDGVNTYQILAVDLTGNLALSGLTLVNGSAAGSQIAPAGGAVFSNGALTLTDCTLSGNTSGIFGGAIFCNGPLTLTGCTFIYNSCQTVGTPSLGGAVFAVIGPVSVTNCLFDTNAAVSDPDSFGVRGYSAGGALVVGFPEYPTNLILNGCQFMGNSAGMNGGAVFVIGEVISTQTLFGGNACVNEGPVAEAPPLPSGMPVGGGALCVLGSSGQEVPVTLNQTHFLYNKVRSDTYMAWGGALMGYYSSLSATRCAFAINIADSTRPGDPSTFSSAGGAIVNMGMVTLSDCLVASNVAGHSLADPTAVGSVGGGILSASLSAVNCTLSGNEASGGGCMAVMGDLTLGNSIAWGNVSWASDVPPIAVMGTSYIAHSDVEGCGGSGSSWFDGVYFIDLGGNIDADPLFVDPANFGWDLQTGSPCIDAGNLDLLAKDAKFDIAGNKRIQGRSVDMGAFERKK